MKKVFMIIITFSAIGGSDCFGQTIKQIVTKDNTKSAQSKDLIRTANDLKSGNWQDVMSSFFQLAAGDITGQQHSFGFKSNLFAIKVKADSSLLIDTNYVKQKFSRNFQFDFSLNLDSVYHFKGLNAGFTWAILNKRDNTVVQFFNDNSLKFNRALEIILRRYRNSIQNRDTASKSSFRSPADSISYRKMRDAIDEALSQGTFSSIVIPAEFRDNRVDSLFEQADRDFKAFLDQVARQPLLTLSATGNFDKQKGMLNGGRFEMVFLKGYSKSSGPRFESDIRASLDLKDTTLNNSKVRRSLADFKGGFTISWIKNNKPIFEFKPNLEYRKVLQGIAPAENEETFYANAEFRLRITDNLWLPLTIKYDTKKGNFLGFLNVSLNLNAFKKT